MVDPGTDFALGGKKRVRVQVERVVREAHCQGGALSNVDLIRLFGTSESSIRTITYEAGIEALMAGHYMPQLTNVKLPIANTGKGAADTATEEHLVCEARRKRQKRANETPEKRAIRLARDRTRWAAKRATMTPEEAAARRVRDNERYAARSPEVKAARAMTQAVYSRNFLDAMTPEEAEAHRAHVNALKVIRVANETPEVKEARLARNRAAWDALPEVKKDACRASNREWLRNFKANETPEDKEVRLASVRAYKARLRANETPEEAGDRRACDRKYDRVARNKDRGRPGGEGFFVSLYLKGLL